jgi:prepilin-type processing-associated H-X9-DG protein
MLRSHRPPRGARAFTLVELLVVIGIIAALIGILLPVLSGVSSRGRDLKCQANLRTIGQMILTYAAENKGSLPYGHYYNQGASHVAPFDWSELPGNNGRLTTVWAIVSRMSGKQYRGDDLFTNPEAKENSAPFLRCPEAELVLPHLCSYVAQFTAFISPSDEYRVLTSNMTVQKRPAVLGELMPFTILAYDTAVVPGMATDVGYVTGADIDEQRFWEPDVPQLRYYSIHDPFSRVPPGIRGNNARIVFPSGGSTGWKNIDPPPITPDGFNTFYYQGNLRFRHNKNASCNALYADGRVESLKASFNGDKSMKKHDVPRKAFMIKWPAGTGIGPNRSFPH